MNGIAFLKMHGLGNDFVILDARARDIPLDAQAIRHIADRHVGVGCDQLIRLEPSDRGDVFMRIWNPDGTEAEACGNATRCVARLLMAEETNHRIAIETVAGLLEGREKDGVVTVDMGQAHLGWQDIPLAREADTMSVDLGAVVPAVCVSMGNPHAVLFVEDCDAIDLAAEGARLEHHPMFPRRANISFVTVESSDRLRSRVWERSAGATLACGSAACAIIVAAARRELTGRSATVALPGGELVMTWREDGHVLMAGPTALSYRGTLDSLTPQAT
jgi:diaminopimelate epimerase